MHEHPAPPSATRLEAAVVEFLECLERGESPDRAALLARYPDVTDDLAQFFADHDRMSGFAGFNSPPKNPLLEPTLSIHGGQPSNTLPNSATTFRIGHYEIHDEIGRGGMGVVYRARHAGLDRQVALKTILSGRFASAEDRARFQTEAIAAAKLSHPGIVPIFEIGEAAGQPFFSMPLIDGPSLAHRLQHGPVSPSTAARLLRKIAEAVAYAHAHGIIHRDLKPGNILLALPESCDPATDAGLDACEPKITDFGLAKRVGVAADLTTTGQIIGTPNYMSPEQAAGRRRDIGPASDVYSLGAILFALLTGQPPFKSENPVEIVLQVIEREPPLPSSLMHNIPRALELICLKCLEKNPAHRYASAAALAEDLDRFLRHEPPLARQPTPAHRLRRWIRRKPVLASHLVGLAVTFMLTQIIFAVHPERDLAYHLLPSGILLLWMAVCHICQWLCDYRHTASWSFYLWTLSDALLLTATLYFIKSPLGVFIGGYLVLIGVSGLAGKTRLIAFTTATSLLGYLLLLVLRPEESQPLHYPAFAAIALLLLGLIVSYQVWRMNVLREYYGDRM